MDALPLKAALTACSNGLSPRDAAAVERLEEVLSRMGLRCVRSPALFAEGASPQSAPPAERARILNDFFADESVGWILDLSGGDLANGVLPYLDYRLIRRSRAVFCGYSDLTSVVNAIWAKTGRACPLYQARRLVGPDADRQQADFAAVLRGRAWQPFAADFVRGRMMEGVLAGGNARCLLKLAGTEYWPSLDGCLLLLEAQSGGEAQVHAYCAQLAQLGAFAHIRGLILGSFTQLDAQCGPQAAQQIALQYVPDTLPVARTAQVGHGADSRTAVIGAPLRLTARS